MLSTRSSVLDKAQGHLQRPVEGQGISALPDCPIAATRCLPGRKTAVTGLLWPCLTEFLPLNLLLLHSLSSIGGCPFAPGSHSPSHYIPSSP